LGGSIQIENHLEDVTWPAMADPTQLELAVLNLAINARDAMNGVGKLTITTGNVILGQPVTGIGPPAGEYVVICVTDTGAGMSEEIQAKAFEPFFTTKGPGKGSGLGLSQILGFAKQSGGGLSLQSRPDEGTTIKIYLPRFQGEQRSAPPMASASIDDGHFIGATILLVDDDDGVREVTGAMLKEMGYVVIEAGSGGAALEIIQSGIKVDLVLLDFAMPGMNGAELGRQIQLKRPRLPLLFVTGFAEQSALAGVGEAFIVQKPFLDDELAKKINAILNNPTPHNVVRLRGATTQNRG
jgi:CheY-like chemotaxis protein